MLYINSAFLEWITTFTVRRAQQVWLAVCT